MNEYITMKSSATERGQEKLKATSNLTNSSLEVNEKQS